MAEFSAGDGKNNLASRFQINKWFLLLLLCVVSAWLGLVNGPGSGWFGQGALDWQTQWIIRGPRVALAMLIGAHLGVAGALLQTLFRNPLAEPYITGVSSGAALGATLGIATGITGALNWSVGGWAGVSLFALIGAVAATLVVIRVASRQGKLDATKLLLAGVALGGLLQALTALVTLQANPFWVRGALFWLLGSLAYLDWKAFWALIPFSLIGLGLSWALRTGLDGLRFGEMDAYHLGLPIERIKWITLSAACVLSASSVAVAGSIAFAGLLAPHLARKFVGSSHAATLPASALIGGALLTLSDLIARMLLPGREIPLGVITGFAGCLFFLGVLSRSEQR
jgi:iron complex transport system permease protein